MLCRNSTNQRVTASKSSQKSSLAPPTDRLDLLTLSKYYYRYNQQLQMIHGIVVLSLTTVLVFLSWCDSWLITKTSRIWEKWKDEIGPLFICFSTILSSNDNSMISGKRNRTPPNVNNMKLKGVKVTLYFIWKFCTSLRSTNMRMVAWVVSASVRSKSLKPKSSSLRVWAEGIVAACGDGRYYTPTTAKTERSLSDRWAAVSTAATPSVNEDCPAVRGTQNRLQR